MMMKEMQMAIVVVVVVVMMVVVGCPLHFGKREREVWGHCDWM